MSRSTRALAAEVLAEVMRGRSLDAPLDAARARLERADDRGLLAALCFGSLRHFYFNRAVVRSLLTRPSQKIDPRVEALMICGIEQIEKMRVAPHAAVSETVAAARSLGLKRATGLINAVLRRFLRERERITDGLMDNDEARYNHPSWLLAALRRDWPEDWRAIVNANNEAAPMWLRVNALRGTRAGYAQALGALDEVSAVPGESGNAAVMVTPALPVTRLPGFADGDVTVQDQAAQLAAQLLAPAAGDRILDACAAPGGKTGHLLELAPGAAVVAVDNAPRRLVRLKENLARLGQTATVVCADLTSAPAARALGQFDRVLLDAPCTGSGVIRRHPDIKLLRRADDSAKLGTRQHNLLANVFAQLKPGGELLYATCSVLRMENDAVIGAFLAREAAAKVEPLAPRPGWGRPTEYGQQRLPGEEESDGFYYARIVKQS